MPNKAEPKQAPFHMVFADGYTVGFLRLFEENKENIHKMLEAWRKPLLNASNLMFCQQLSSHGLLDKDEDSKIMLSYIDLIYVEIMKVLMQFGAKPCIINSIKDLFAEKNSEHFTTSYTPLSEILLSGHNGLDVEFAYTANDETITIYDYLFAPLFLGQQKEATMQFSLIPILNKVRTIFKNMEPIETRHSMYDCFHPLSKEDILTESELSAIEKMRQLKGSETLSLKHKQGEDDKYIASIISDIDDDNLSKDLNSLCKKYDISDFSDVSIKRRNGGVASIKTTEQEII